MDDFTERMRRASAILNMSQEERDRRAKKIEVLGKSELWRQMQLSARKVGATSIPDNPLMDKILEGVLYDMGLIELVDQGYLAYQISNGSQNFIFFVNPDTYYYTLTCYPDSDSFADRFLAEFENY